MKLAGSVALSFLLSVAMLQSTLAASSEKEIVEKFISSVARPDKTPNARNAFRDAAQSMDFEEMARRSFGDAGWAKFSSEERKEVTALFRRLVEIRFYPRWRRVFQNGRYEVSSQTREGSDALVSGALQMGGKKSDLTFRLAKGREGFRLVSMKVNDKDMLERTSVRLKRGLKQRGAAGLIAHLKKKTEESPRDVSDKARLEELISGGK